MSNYTSMLLEEDLIKTQTGFEARTTDGKDKSSPTGSAPFKHYRRSKTNKAPRKRSFIANMTKSPEALTEALASAAAGAGKGPNGNRPAFAFGNGSGNVSPFSSAGPQAHPAGASVLPRDLSNLPALASPVVYGAKHLASMGAAGMSAACLSHQPVAQQTGTYYDAELVAALAAYMPDAVGPPPQQHARAANTVSWAVTTAHNELAASHFGRAVMTGLEPRKSDGSAAPQLLVHGNSFNSAQLNMSAGAVAMTSDGSFEAMRMQRVPSDCSMMVQRMPSGTASNASWAHAAQLGSKPLQKYNKQSALAAAAYNSSVSPGPAAYYSDSGSLGSAADEVYNFGGFGAIHCLPLSSSSSGTASAPPAPAAAPTLPGAPHVPFSLQLDPSGWLALPSRLPSSFGAMWEEEAQNPSMVVCHTLLSVGAYGAVYEGTLQLQPWQTGAAPRFRDVAVKIMRQAPLGGGMSAESMLRSFQVEADLLPGLSHPNVVPVYYVNADPSLGPVCLVQELATLGNLASYIHPNSAFSDAIQKRRDQQVECAVLARLAQRLGITTAELAACLEASPGGVASPARQQGQRKRGAPGGQEAQKRRKQAVLLSLLHDVAAALNYLGGLPQPVVHRDVKPANILIAADGRAMLADFGVARLVDAPGAAAIEASSMLLQPLAALPLLDAAAAAPWLGSAETDLMATLFDGWTKEEDDSDGFELSFDELPDGGDVVAAPAKRQRTAVAVPEPEGEALLLQLPFMALPLSGQDGMSSGWMANLLMEDEADVAAKAAPPAMGSPVPAALPALSAPAAVPLMDHGLRGTVHYAAPEDLCSDARRPVGPPVDVFSFAYCLWEALGGQRPWAGMGSSAIIESVGGKGMRPPINRGWSLRLQEAIRRSWAAEPGARPAMEDVAGAMHAELRGMLGL